MENFCGAKAFCAQPKHQALVQSSNWLQQVLLPHWLISSYVELCHILAAPQRTPNIVLVFSSWVYSNLLTLSKLSGVCHPELLAVFCEKFMSPLAWEGPVYPPHVLPAASGCGFFLWLASNCLTVVWCSAKPFWECSISMECVPSHPYTCSQIHCNAGKGSCKTALFWAIYFKIYLKLEQVPTPAGNTMRVLKVWLSQFFSF